MTDRPAVRVREWRDEQTRVTRIAQPRMHPNENLVDVEYRILVEELATAKLDRFDEVHRMRYLFKPELELLLQGAGMRILEVFEWETWERAGFTSWAATLVVQKGIFKLISK